MNIIDLDSRVPRKLWRDIHYPKLILLLLTFVIAYFLYAKQCQLPFYEFIENSGYAGAFFAGFFLAYGFTAAPAVAVLLILGNGQNIWITGLVAGVGGVIGDLIIFKIVRYSFEDEIIRLEKQLAKEKVVKEVEMKMSRRLKTYLIAMLAGIIIASPLPDELGVGLMASAKVVAMRFFLIFAYILHLIGIFIILFIGRAI